MKRGGFIPALIGGVVAAFLGFAAAKTDVLEPYLPAALKSGSSTAALEAQLADQAQALAALRADLAAAKPDLAPIMAQVKSATETATSTQTAVAELRQAVAPLSDQVAAVDARLTELEKRPLSAGAAPEAVAAYERELTAMKESLSAQRAEVEKMVADARATEARAAEAAQLAANRTALAELRAALDSGSPFSGLLSELAAGGVTVPDALTVAAQDGVITLAALRDGFAPAARDALAAARAGAKGTDRSLTAFLQRQLGARSVAPREGTDPDAILSRAEAALTAGNLSAALSEVDSLPEAARAAMADWSTLAHLRANAIAAADTLAQSLNTN
uniref:COG4223 family protein n=1 Tax=Pseudodonghicola xiamenensis TaxID=337702 RepID=UPI0004132420|nr:hypothetical protein [Pseudodonghicola xiamenensis]